MKFFSCSKIKLHFDLSFCTSISLVMYSRTARNVWAPYCTLLHCSTLLYTVIYKFLLNFITAIRFHNWCSRGSFNSFHMSDFLLQTKIVYRNCIFKAGRDTCSRVARSLKLYFNTPASYFYGLLGFVLVVDS